MKRAATPPAPAVLVAVWLAASLLFPGCGSDVEEVPPTACLDGREPIVIDKITRARERVVADPSAASWAAYARILHAHDLPSEALAAYVVAARHTSGADRFPILYLAGYSQIIHDADRAIEILLRANEIRDDYIPLHLHVGRLLEAAERRDAARKHFERALQLARRPSAAPWEGASVPHALLGLGRLALADGRTTEALSILEQARSISPETPQIHTALAMAYARLGRKDDAARAAGSAGRLEGAAPMDDPIAAVMFAESESPGVVMQLAADAMRKADHARAIALYDRALANHPDFVDAVIGKAAALAILGRWKDIEPLVDRVLIRRPDSSDALALKGACRLDANDQAAAIPLFRRAIELDPTNRVARHNLGRVLGNLGLLAEASAHLGALLEHHPSLHDVRLDLATILAAQGRRAEALSEIERVLAAEPRNEAALAQKQRLSH